MSNATNLDKSQTFLNQAEAFERVSGSTLRIIKTIGEDGIWIVLGLDIVLVTGEVHEDDTVLFLQRKAVNDMFDEDSFLDILEKHISVPFTDIKIPNPIAPIAKLIKPYGQVLRRSRKDENGKVIFEAIDPISRIVLAIAIPGFLKIALELLPKLIPG